MGADIGKNRIATQQVGTVAVSARYHRLPRKIEDDYEVLNSVVLGTGYNGAVTKAKRKGQKDSQDYAVKMFNLDNITSSAKTQLITEVDVFLGMDHPHVARLFDVYDAKNKLYLVMECMEGGELFDRVTEKKRFSEADAAEGVGQMLLAINYLHSHGIVHRDLKLENFLYDWKESDHLKLIDFGFSKVWDPSVKMQHSCGTLSYVAPEVLAQSYTSQCDMWSLGVITFILLAGYMPFFGNETKQTTNIKQGNYTMKPEKWDSISKPGVEFVKSLLEVNPKKRITAEQALAHPWIASRQSAPEVDIGIVDNLRQFGQASKFKRACLTMMAWSLSNEERAKVREYFVAMDTNKHGTITLGELKAVMIEKFHIPDEETKAVFEALDSNHDDTIHYSDFLAAMLTSRIALHGDLLQTAFKRLDADNSGYITVENLKQVLGDQYQGEDVSNMIKDADLLQDGRVSFDEFVAYLRGTPLESHAAASAQIIDQELVRSADKNKTGIRRKSKEHADTSATPSKNDASNGNGNTEAKPMPQCCIVC